MGGIVVPGGKPTKGRSEKKAKATRPSRKIQLAVRQELISGIDNMAEDVEQLKNLILTGTPREVNRALKELQEKWRVIYGNQAEAFAQKWVASLSARQKEEFQRNMAKAMGVDYTYVFDDKVVRSAAELMSVKAGDLITKIPEETLGRVREAVLQNYQQIPFAEGRSLIDEVEHIFGVSRARAKLIARDQTSKINTAITQARNEEVGIKSYIWRTAKDSRVVGTPGGLYPEGNRVHGNHYKREGQEFYWNDPPSDGHPGYAINCRCYAEPKVVVSELKYV